MGNVEKSGNSGFKFLDLDLERDSRLMGRPSVTRLMGRPSVTSVTCE